MRLVLNHLCLLVTAALFATTISATATGAEAVTDGAPADVILNDWMLQDHGRDTARCFQSDKDATVEIAMARRVIEELGSAADRHRDELRKLTEAAVPGADPRWKSLYAKLCQERRRLRLRRFSATWPQVVFTKHYDIGGSHYAYTEGQSDAQAERTFRPGSALCILEISATGETKQRTLIDDPKGVIRDPDVSYDGKRILFAWKKSDREDDYHLYEMDVATRQVRQLTFGVGIADYEGAYLPNDDIIFNSSRCVQIVDCWWTEVSNLYTCDADGKYLRRLTFDQVHTNFPQVLEDGRVIYTRWDYNDRGQIYPQPLFQMNPDGTAQAEFYGNNSWFPTTILHARGVPGTYKVVAVLSGHHSHQRGKLALIDPAQGWQEADGVQLIAPVRETKAVRVDAYGQDGEQFQYPYPLSETEFLVTYSPDSGGNRRYRHRFGIYSIDIDGRRELLAWDPKVSSSQPVPLAARKRPFERPTLTDYAKKTGTYFVQDVYAGMGLRDVPRGTVKRLRVVALEFRAAGIGNNGNGGPAGGAMISTPVSLSNGTWDVKRVLGSVPVSEDGSAVFEVPAHTPVYFQLLDEKNHVIQSMRSWSTLQPGETLSCVGCHDHKSTASSPHNELAQSLRKTAEPVPLEPFHGPARGFSFPQEIQPILDRRCVRCHDDRSAVPKKRGQAPAVVEGSEHAFSLLGAETVDRGAKRRWSDAYLALTRHGQPNKVVNWLNVQSVPTPLAPYHAGAAKSSLIALLEEGHYDVELSREELDKIACWIDLLVPYCGEYTEAAEWNDGEKKKYARYLEKRERLAAQERENIAALRAAQEAGEASDDGGGAVEGGRP